MCKNDQMAKDMDMDRTVTKSIATIGAAETGWFYFDSSRLLLLI